MTTSTALRRLAMAAVFLVGAGCSSSGEKDTTSETNPVELVSVEVTQGDLSSDREFNGTVNHGDQWSVTTVAQGTVTSSQPKGNVVGFGEVLIEINDKPIVLAEGPVPMYREMYNAAAVQAAQNAQNPEPAQLPEGADGAAQQPIQTTTTVQIPPIEGDDVLQLQKFLAAQGFDLNGNLVIDGNYGSRTEDAVKAWQKERGQPETGRIDSSQLVFSPQPVRIENDIRVGAVFEGLLVTPAEPIVSVITDSRDRAVFEIDTEVEVKVEGGDGETITGIVSRQESVTDETGNTGWETTITPSAPLPADATDVDVTVREVGATDSLLVPVSALLALAEGGYAVEIPDGDTTKLVGVELVEVMESTAAIDGELQPGDAVLIPDSGS